MNTARVLILERDRTVAGVLQRAVRAIAPAEVVDNTDAAELQLRSSVGHLALLADGQLIDQPLSGVPFLTTARRLRPRLPLLIMNARHDDSWPARALRANASYLCKPIDTSTVLHFLRGCAALHACADLGPIAQSVTEIARKYGLTAREVELIDHAIRGTAREEQLRALRIANGTLRTQVRTLLRKLGQESMDRVAIAILREALGS